MKSIKNSWLIMGMCILMAGCAGSARVVVRERPHPPAYVRPAPPHPGWVWVNGNWIWSHGRYQYRNGYWVAPRRGFSWQPGHWQRMGHGWHWTEGRWRRA